MPTKQPELGEFLNKVKSISGRLRYPIHNFEQLVKALGGAQATVDWEGRKVAVGQAKHIFPNHFFPIESEDDLLTKAVNLELLRPGTKLASGAKGQEMQPTPDRRPPGHAFDEREVLEKLKGHAGGPAVVRGHRS